MLVIQIGTNGYPPTERVEPGTPAMRYDMVVLIMHYGEGYQVAVQHLAQANLMEPFPEPVPAAA